MSQSVSKEVSGFTQRVEELVDHLEKLMFHFLYKRSLEQCPADIGKQEFVALWCLGKKRGCRMSDIAENTGLSLSSATAVIDKLEAKNFVRRDRSSEDRRVVSVSLTEEGEKLYQIARDIRLEMGKGMLEPLTKDEQIQLLSLFRKMSHNLFEKELK
jgi:DNA-binding MarR family transcriptional regulator